MSITNTQRYN